jgi:hypothetical protein
MFSSQNVILKVTLGVALTILLAVTFLPTSSFATTTPTLSQAPLYLSFKPNPVHAKYGQTVTEIISGKNTGGYTFQANYCYLWYRIGTSGNWNKVTQCFPNAHWPIYVSPHSTKNAILTQKVKINENYKLVIQYKLQAFGFYGTPAAMSYPGTVTIYINE